MADTDVIDQLILRYIEAARSLWNTYFLSPGAADDTVDDMLRRFTPIRRQLFDALVMAPLGREDDRESEEDPIRCFQVQASDGPLTVLVEHPGKDGDRYWEAAPKDAEFSTADLQFVEIFDWDPRVFRDMAYVKVWIVSGPPNASLDQRYALFERQSVSILHRPGEPV